MAVNSLSLAECLRPWRNAGLYTLLAEPGETAFAAADECVEELPPGMRDERPLAPAAPAAPAASADFSRPHRQRTDALPADAGGAGASQAATHAVARSGPASGPPSAPANDPQPGLASGPQPGPASGPQPGLASGPQPGPAGGMADLAAAWPAPWQALLARTRPSPILWTYAELGADLHGRGIPERSDCLKNIIRQLQLPKGSSTFWPLALDMCAPGASASPEFVQGLALLKPQAVILFGGGDALLSQLCLDLNGPFQQTFTQGSLFLLLPEFSVLLRSGDALNAAIVFLRASLSGLPALFR